MSAPTTVVLVHGAWHGAWCFDPVGAVLRQRGVEVLAVDLPGHGDDPGPFGDLHDDARRVTQVLDTIEGEVVLVGHSYGGAVITEAGDHERVRHLVYLAAFPLQLDESCVAAAVDDPGTQALSHEGRPDVTQALVWGDDGTASFDPAGAVEILYNRCNRPAQEWAVARLGPQVMANLGQSPTREAWRDRPSTYAMCTDDQIVHPGLQAIMAARCTHQVEWDTDHSPFLSRPELVVDLLAQVADAPE